MTLPPHSERPAEEARPLLHLVLPLFFLIAALSQLLFLFHWPMYLYGRWVPFLPAAGVALVRMGLYTGIGWGLFRRDAAAWAAGVGELARSVLLFLLAVWQHEGMLTGETFPAWWAQGVLSAALPVLLVLLTALDWGWRPGSRLVLQVSAAARFLAALAVFAAISLRGSAAHFGVEQKREAGVFLTRGLPLLVLLTAVELTAWLAAGSRP